MKEILKGEKIWMILLEVLKAFWDTAKNVLPIVLFLCVFQLIILRKPILLQSER